MSALPRASGRSNAHPDPIEKQEAKLREEALRFIRLQANEIIGKAADHLPSTALPYLVGMLSQLDPLVAAEILLGIEDNLPMASLLTSEFVQNIQKFSPRTACSLLYAMRVTGNIKSLSDPAMSLPHVISFLNALDTELAYEWCASIGYTSNVKALTSANVLSDYLAKMPDADAKFAGDFSLAVGLTGEIGLLSDDGFVNFLRSLPPGMASEYMSGIWCTGQDLLYAGGKGLPLVPGFNDVVAYASSRRRGVHHTAAAPRMLLVRAAAKHDPHDRGIKFTAKFLYASGFDFIYEDIVDDPESVVEFIARRGIRAVAFSLSEDSYRDVIMRTAELLRLRGLSDTVILAGGVAGEESISELKAHGVRFLTGVTAGNDMLSIVKEHTRRSQGIAGTSPSHEKTTASRSRRFSGSGMPVAFVNSPSPSGMRTMLLVASAGAMHMDPTATYTSADARTSAPDRQAHTPSIAATASLRGGALEVQKIQKMGEYHVPHAPSRHIAATARTRELVRPENKRVLQLDGPRTMQAANARDNIAVALLQPVLTSLRETSHGHVRQALSQDMPRRLSQGHGALYQESGFGLAQQSVALNKKSPDRWIASIATMSAALVFAEQFLAHGNSTYLVLAVAAFTLAGQVSFAKPAQDGGRGFRNVIRDVEGKIGAAIRSIIVSRRASKMRQILRKAERAEALASELLDEFRAPHELQKDYYATLKLSRTGDSKRIRDAYIALIKERHPDVNKEADAEEKAKELNEAYKVLSDKEARRDYDLLLSDAGPAADAAEVERIADRIMKEYDAARNAEYESFIIGIQDRGMSTQEFFYRVEYFIDWKKTFDGTINGMFKKFFALGKEISAVRKASEGLSARMADSGERRVLQETSSKFKSILSRYEVASGTVAAAIKRSRAQISKAERKVESDIRSQIY